MTLELTVSFFFGKSISDLENFKNIDVTVDITTNTVYILCIDVIEMVTTI